MQHEGIRNYNNRIFGSKTTRYENYDLDKRKQKEKDRIEIESKDFYRILFI